VPAACSNRALSNGADRAAVISSSTNHAVGLVIKNSRSAVSARGPAADAVCCGVDVR